MTPPINTPTFSVVLPAFNEASVIGRVVGRVREQFPHAEVLVVDDGSNDKTGLLAAAAGARVVTHPQCLGNGAAIKTGARHARGTFLVFMDADGQHDAADIPRLLAPLANGYEMTVGARKPQSHAGLVRRLGNGVLNWFAAQITGQQIPDLTSGFRAVRAITFRRFLYLLPNGFSYPTTITRAFMRTGMAVCFEPIQAGRRVGKSKIRLATDGPKFLVIIMKIITLFSPMRLFMPVSILLLTLGLARYGYVYYISERLTNMPVLLFVASLLTFLIGLVSEQITALHLSASSARMDTLERQTDFQQPHPPPSSE